MVWWLSSISMPSQGQGPLHLGGPGPRGDGEVLLHSHQCTRTMYQLCLESGFPLCRVHSDRKRLRRSVWARTTTRGFNCVKCKSKKDLAVEKECMKQRAAMFTSQLSPSNPSVFRSESSFIVQGHSSGLSTAGFSSTKPKEDATRGEHLCERKRLWLCLTWEWPVVPFFFKVPVPQNFINNVKLQNRAGSNET